MTPDRPHPEGNLLRGVAYGLVASVAIVLACAWVIYAVAGALT